MTLNEFNEAIVNLPEDWTYEDVAMLHEDNEAVLSIMRDQGLINEGKDND